jgi:hypothetical protein
MVSNIFTCDPSILAYNLSIFHLWHEPLGLHLTSFLKIESFTLLQPYP